MKPFKTYEEQLNIFESRGLIIDVKKEEVLSFLKENNYYRLSGYAKLFEDLTTNTFKEGISFSFLREVYIFDFDFRRLLNDLLEEVEITVRTQFAYNIAKNLSPVAYIKENLYYDKKQFKELLNEIKHAKERNKNHPVIMHHKGKTIPIWAMIEFLSLGTVSRMFGNLMNGNKSYITKNDFYNMPHKAFKNYLHVATLLRNKCAHRGRIYGATIMSNFSVPKDARALFDKYNYPLLSASNTSIFQSIFASFRLLNNPVSINKYIEKIQSLFDKYRNYINPNKMGFYDEWDVILRG